jgi:hypothetical protein
MAARLFLYRYKPVKRKGNLREIQRGRKKHISQLCPDIQYHFGGRNYTHYRSFLLADDMFILTDLLLSIITAEQSMPANVGCI